MSPIARKKASAIIGIASKPSFLSCVDEPRCEQINFDNATEYCSAQCARGTMKVWPEEANHMIKHCTLVLSWKVYANHIFDIINFNS